MIVSPPILRPDPRPGTKLEQNAFAYTYELRLANGKKLVCYVPKQGGHHSCWQIGRWH